MPDPQVPDPESPGVPVPFASVDIRNELALRPSRPPNFEAEDHALAKLAAVLADSPREILQQLAETALDLCRADTAGVSLLEKEDGEDVLRWAALAGIGTEARDRILPRAACPCGVCIAENATQLVHLPDRCFPALRAEPRIVEGLVIPFRIQGRAAGTVWIAMRQPDRKFDRENERVMRTLAAFASAGWQLSQATAAVAELNAVLSQEIEERKRTEEELRRVQGQLQSLPAMLVQAQETERRLLARELHDDFSQKLVALGLEAAALSRAKRESRAKLDSRIRDLGRQIGALADDVHRMSRHLHPSILDDLGLEAALREECSVFSRRLGVPVRFYAVDVPRPLSGEITRCLFRVAQESLRNIHKHAGAREVRVRLARSGDDLALFVEDVGDGFDLARVRGKGGLGLISMEERVRMVNGTFEIRSRPGVGTEVEVHVPLPGETP